MEFRTGSKHDMCLHFDVQNKFIFVIDIESIFDEQMYC